MLCKNKTISAPFKQNLNQIWTAFDKKPPYLSHAATFRERINSLRKGSTDDTGQHLTASLRKGMDDQQAEGYPNDSYQYYGESNNASNRGGANQGKTK